MYLFPIQPSTCWFLFQNLASLFDMLSLNLSDIVSHSDTFLACQKPDSKQDLCQWFETTSNISALVISIIPASDNVFNFQAQFGSHLI